MAINTAVSYAVAALKADTATAAIVGARVYDTAAPSSAAYPMIVVSKMSSTPFANINKTNIFDDEIIVVKALDQSTVKTNVYTLITRARAVLHKSTGAGVLLCAEEMEIPLGPIQTNGLTYQQAAYEFRVHTQ